MAKWAESIAARSRPPDLSSTPKKVYNVISLEITGTELARRVRPPQLVREVDWVDNYWHFGPGGKTGDVELQPGDAKPQAINGNGLADGRAGEKAKGKVDWPKVQLYCLVGDNSALLDRD